MRAQPEKAGDVGVRGAKEDWKYEETKDVTDGDFDVDDDGSVLGDADAQWGRQIQAGGDVGIPSGRQERRMR